MDELIIVGAGGFAREVAWLVADINAAAPRWNLLGFLDDDPTKAAEVAAYGPLLGGLGDYAGFGDRRPWLACAIGSPKGRRKVVARLDAQGARWATLVHPTAFVGTGSTLGEGAIVCRDAGVTVDVRVGRHVHFNIKSGCGHDVQVGEFSTLSAHVDVTGKCRLGAAVFLGSHAVVLPGTEVGDEATIGAGTVAMRRVEGGTTVFGVPAREIA